MIIPTHLALSGSTGIEVGTGGDTIRNPFAYNGLTINHPNDSPVETYEIDAIVVNDQIVVNGEPLPARDGSEAYHPFKVRKLIRMDGVVKSATLAGLADKVAALHRAFDPVNAYNDDSATAYSRGYLPLTFYIPTADTNYNTIGNFMSTGLTVARVIPAQVYARCIVRPIQRASKYEGYNGRISIQWECIDPRVYLQTTDTVALTENTNTTVDNSKAKYSSWPTFSLTLGTTPDSTGYIRLVNSGLNDLILNLQGMIAGDVVTIDFEHQAFYKNGTLAMNIFSGGQVFDLQPVSQQIKVYTGSTGPTLSVTWRRAFP